MAKKFGDRQYHEWDTSRYHGKRHFDVHVPTGMTLAGLYDAVLQKAQVPLTPQDMQMLTLVPIHERNAGRSFKKALVRSDDNALQVLAEHDIKRKNDTRCLLLTLVVSEGHERAVELTFEKTLWGQEQTEIIVKQVDHPPVYLNFREACDIHNRIDSISYVNGALKDLLQKQATIDATIRIDGYLVGRYSLMLRYGCPVELVTWLDGRLIE